MIHGRVVSQSLTRCHAGLCSSVEPSFEAATMIAAKITIARIVWIVWWTCGLKPTAVLIGRKDRDQTACDPRDQKQHDRQRGHRRLGRLALARSVLGGNDWWQTWIRSTVLSRVGLVVWWQSDRWRVSYAQPELRAEVIAQPATPSPTIR